MKTDAQLRADVFHELDWDPAVKSHHVGVSVGEGIVTLSGHLDTYAEKFAVERAVERVEGVKALAVELDVKLAPSHQRSDTEIAAAAESAFVWHALIQAERLRVKVEKGWVTLAGELDWNHQRHVAEKAVRSLTGVVGVTNHIMLRPVVTPGDVTARIRNALSRQAERRVRHIDVSVAGSTVTLRGKVGSWAERAAAQGAAWSAPGISLVVNQIAVASGA